MACWPANGRARWAPHVIGTVGSKAKADLALAMAATTSSSTTRKTFVDRVKQISPHEYVMLLRRRRQDHVPGLAVPVLKPRGLFVSFRATPSGRAAVRGSPSSTTTVRCLRHAKTPRPMSHPARNCSEGRHAVRRRINGKLHVPIK